MKHVINLHNAVIRSITEDQNLTQKTISEYSVSNRTADDFMILVEKFERSCGAIVEIMPDVNCTRVYFNETPDKEVLITYNYDLNTLVITSYFTSHKIVSHRNSLQQITALLKEIKDSLKYAKMGVFNNEYYLNLAYKIRRDLTGRRYKDQAELETIYILKDSLNGVLSELEQQSMMFYFNN